MLGLETNLCSFGPTDPQPVQTKTKTATKEICFMAACKTPMPFVLHPHRLPGRKTSGILSAGNDHCLGSIAIKNTSAKTAPSWHIAARQPFFRNDRNQRIIHALENYPNAILLRLNMEASDNFLFCDLKEQNDDCKEPLEIH